MGKLGLLLLAGGAGSILRYFLSEGVYGFLGTKFPYGTLIVNTIGCFIAGFFFVLVENKILSPDVKIILFAGFLGAFTTFSALIMETVSLSQKGAVTLAVVNVGLSIFFGILVFILGVSLAKMIA